MMAESETNLPPTISSAIETDIPSLASLDPSLLSMEKLDRASPDLWPEQMPGVSEFAIDEDVPESNPPSPKPTATTPKDLDPEDYNMLIKYSLLSGPNLIAEVKRLQNLAYQLGLEEAKEMTRGKYLNILSRRRR